MNVITLDIDRAYQWWVNGVRGTFDNDVRETHPIHVWVRRSAFNGVHVKLEYEYDMDVLEALAVRAKLGDDQYRIYKDLQRYYETGNLDDMMRLFDEKWYPHGKAGEWKEITIVR